VTNNECKIDVYKSVYVYRMTKDPIPPSDRTVDLECVFETEAENVIVTQPTLGGRKLRSRKVRVDRASNLEKFISSRLPSLRRVHLIESSRLSRFDRRILRTAERNVGVTKADRVRNGKAEILMIDESQFLRTDSA